jgi:type I restriction enzyme S subunit
MQEKAKEPEIRFAGFTGAWEQRKFSKLYKRSSEKNDGSIGIERNITVATMQFKSDIRLSSDDYLKTYFTFKVGDIAFEGHQSKEFRYGRFVENDIGDGVVSHIFTVFRPIQRFDLHFWKYAISSENLMQKILSRSTKASTMMHDLVPEDFLNETFLVPSIDEQKAVGKFLHQIDNLLTLHQRKYEKLLNIKKSMLEKMFPKEGEVVPEIRFKGFTGAWEQRKLSDGMTEYTDRVFIEDDQIYRQVTVKNTGEISLRGSQPGRNIGRKRQARVNLRDYPMTLIFTRQTVEQGGIGFAKNDVDGCIVTENMPTIAVDGKKFNQDFLVAFFKTYGFRKDVILSNIEGGTAQIAIHEDDILDSSSTFPSLKEQIKIGNFFRTLSQQITLHQRKLEMLKNVKQAFLEKMFV